MITIEKKLELQMTYPVEHFGSIESILFFDIETTGFSGDFSNLYLIGCTYYREASWHLIQWFADRADAEEEMLHSFFEFLKNFKSLIHFNGDGFDIPYLLKRCKAYGLSHDFSNVKSIDIYRLAKPLKKLLGLENLKQKSIESFLRIDREDKYNGGQLIEVYHEYLLSHDQFLYSLLVLHNEDDLKGMPSILPILFYPDFLRGCFAYDGIELSTQSDLFGVQESKLTIYYKGCCPVPIPVQTENTLCSLEISGDNLAVTVPLLDGELKRYYADYQNYYYLVCEDNAIHKSVGQYVDKDVKKKATAKTCYTRISGTFLPQPIPVWDMCLKAEYKDKITYVPFTPELFSDEDKALTYLDGVLKSFI